MFNAEAQPVVRDSVATSSVDERLTFVKRIYGWMTVAILVAGLGSYLSITSGITEQVLFRGGWAASIVVMLAWIGLAYAARAVRHKPGVNVAVYGVYALFTGFAISSLILVAMLMAQMMGQHSLTYIYQAFGITAGIFGGLTLYVMTTKRDFSWLRSFLFAGLIGLLLAIILNIFIGGTVFGLIISAFGVLLFSGYVIYDTQRILKSYPSKEYIAASLELFLDFVMLFVYVLRLIIYIAAMSRE